MKIVTFLFLIFLVSPNLFAQKGTPSAVLEAFNELEPNVQMPYWEYREGAFVAMFPQEDDLKKVFFNAEGEWLESRTRIERASLPSGVNRFIDEHYSNADITYVGRVDLPERTLYRVESELMTYVVIKLLNEQGVLVKENRIDWSYIPN